MAPMIIMYATIVSLALGVSLGTRPGAQEEVGLSKVVERTLGDRDEEALALLRRSPAAAATIIRMVDEGHPMVVPLLSLLGKLGAAGAEDFLGKHLAHEEVPVRVAAAWSLGKLRSRKFLSNIIALLGDAALNDRQKGLVARALGEISDTRAVESLRGFVADLAARGVKSGTPVEETDRALMKLGILQKADVLQRDKLLSDVLVQKHSDVEGLELRLWAAERLAVDGRSVSVPFIRQLLVEQGGNEGLSREVKIRLLQAISKLGGALSAQESAFLSEVGGVK